MVDKKMSTLGEEEVATKLITDELKAMGHDEGAWVNVTPREIDYARCILYGVSGHGVNT